MGLLDGITVNRCLPPISYPTASGFDMQIGEALQGVDGKWYFNGGISRGITGIVAGPNAYKSTIMGSLVMRSKTIHSGTDVIIHDTEGSFTRDPLRELRLAGEFSDKSSHENMVYLDGSNTIDELEAIVDDICTKKDKARKDYIVDSPFLDLSTGKPMQMWIPTYIVVDTWTNAISADEVEIQTKGVGDSKNNTIFMKGGQKKTIYLPKLNMQCNRYGLCVILVCHVGKQSTMGQTNPNVPPPKQLMHMRQGEQIKGTGSQFDRLTNPLLQVTSVKKLIAADGDSEYKYGSAPADDLNEIVVKVLRNKIGQGSGTSTAYVVSQKDGLQNTLSYYNYMRSNKYTGLLGNVQRHQCAFMPDVTLTRNTARGLFHENPKLCRAMELTAQYVYIKENWNLNNMPFDFSKTPEQVYETLSKSSELLERVLTSRGYWLAGFDSPSQEYLSIFDVLALAK